VYCTSNDSSCTVLGLLFILQFSSENQRKIFFLVIKKHSNDQCDCRKCYINICDIKNRKIDQAEIKEINVGNMSARDNTEHLKPTISVTPEEKKAFEEILAKGVEITTVLVPNAPKTYLKDSLS